MAKKRNITKRSPEEKQDLLQKINELRTTPQENGKPMTVAQACEEVGVPYATYNMWNAAKKAKKTRPYNRRTTSLPAIIPGARQATNDPNFLTLSTDDESKVVDDNFTCIVIKGKGQTVEALAKTLGGLMRH